MKKIVNTGPNNLRWSFGTGRNPLGQVSTAIDRLPGLQHQYGYDAFARLTSDTRSNRTQTSWSYDLAHRLTGSTDTGHG